MRTLLALGVLGVVSGLAQGASAGDESGSIALEYKTYRTWKIQLPMEQFMNPPRNHLDRPNWHEHICSPHPVLATP